MEQSFENMITSLDNIEAKLIQLNEMLDKIIEKIDSVESIINE